MRLAFYLVWWLGLAYAQSYRGEISGTVKDATGR